MPLIPYPNVPPDPGVPPLPRLPDAVSTVISLLTGDSVADPGSGFGGIGETDSPQWGYFDDSGNAIIQAETVLDFEAAKEYAISNYPTEASQDGASGQPTPGGFQSYNKVERPGDVRIRFFTGGSASDQQAMSDSVDAAISSLNLYTAVTPNLTLENINIIHRDQHHTRESGSNSLTIDVWGQEVRNTAQASFTDTATTGAQDAQNDGSVTAQKPDGDQKGAAATGTT